MISVGFYEIVARSRTTKVVGENSVSNFMRTISYRVYENIEILFEKLVFRGRDK